jgi:glycosyltransferase involved in cell wall biosynthesis
VPGLHSYPSVSIIIPTWNGVCRIQRCLDALHNQNIEQSFEIIVVNDGSDDDTAEIVARDPRVRLISQPNAGPAAARNHGAQKASGEIIVFTDDDCEPAPNWLTQILRPFDDLQVVAAKGAYRTRQQAIIARFVQIEYEDRYRLMARHPAIDFVDTYSAAFRRDRFLEMDGYDTSFPIACAEDVELSYRMSARGWKMVFAPAAIVYHQHPDRLFVYLKKKFKFAFWRVVAVKKNPSKALKDSHTPQLMKSQLAFLPALVIASVAALCRLSSVQLPLLIALVFALSTLPFSVRAFTKDPVTGILSPFILALRSFAQFLGTISSVYYVLRSSTGQLAPSTSLHR